MNMNVVGILSGGGARVGLEDNIWYDARRSKLATNRELVERIVSTVRVLGFSPYSPAEARELLALAP